MGTYLEIILLNRLLGLSLRISKVHSLFATLSWRVALKRQCGEQSSIFLWGGWKCHFTRFYHLRAVDRWPATLVAISLWRFDHRSSCDRRINIKSKIKSSSYSPYYTEACNELRGPSPRLSACVTQLRRNVATVASRWRHCADLTGPVIEPQTSRTDSVRFATELTAGLDIMLLNKRLCY